MPLKGKRTYFFLEPPRLELLRELELDPLRLLPLRLLLPPLRLEPPRLVPLLPLLRLLRSGIFGSYAGRAWPMCVGARLPRASFLQNSFR
jgi:hypothetical protein